MPNPEENKSVGLAQVVERNICALLARRQAEEKKLGWQERRRMDVMAARNPELEELSQDVAPEKVLEKIEENEARFVQHSASS